MEVIATAPPDRSKPNHALGIRQDRIDRIRAQTASGTVKRESLRLSTGETEDTTPVRPYPDFRADSLDCHHRTGRSFVANETRRFVARQCPGLLLLAACSDPKLAIAVCLQRPYEESYRTHVH